MTGTKNLKTSPDIPGQTCSMLKNLNASDKPSTPVADCQKPPRIDQINPCMRGLARVDDGRKWRNPLVLMNPREPGESKRFVALRRLLVSLNWSWVQSGMLCYKIIL